MKNQTIAPKYQLKAKVLDAIGVILLMLFMAIFGCAIVLLSAPNAKADPDSVSFAYAATYGGAVCSTLDSHPTFNGILGIGQAIVNDGLSTEQAGTVIVISVREICPRHMGLINRFINTYAPKSATA